MVGSIASSPAVDLSTLPAPVLVAQPDFETRLAAKMARLIAQMPAFSALVESDPAMLLLQADTYDEVVLAQAVNDMARGFLLAFATGANLDHLGALMDVPRLTVTAATDTAAAAMEGDTAYRQRIQLAPHRFSVAGPELAYVFHARSAHGDIADVKAFAPNPDDIKALVLDLLADNEAAADLIATMADALDDADWPGVVRIAVLAASGDGVPSPDVLSAVDTALQGPVRPMTDIVIVQPAEPVDFAIEARLFVFAGPDQGLILSTAQDSLAAHLEDIRKLDRDAARSAIIAALHVGNVQRVELLQPPTDVVVDWFQVGNPVSVSITIAGTEL
ncbi:hypothetical protein A8V01_02725 [Novosphingobium guangzhouense]|uniref:Baseplate J-like central domain-containing protein n=2 Tax=Novosphingobium guangzhouense TaxID=1850347 RepID=A0A2K2G607_9SPHN|nr:hypothetical protein A8V01_02725 [Novosphingobium guangzhouense]